MGFVEDCTSLYRFPWKHSVGTNLNNCINIEYCPPRSVPVEVLYIMLPWRVAVEGINFYHVVVFLVDILLSPIISTLPLPSHVLRDLLSYVIM